MSLLSAQNLWEKKLPLEHSNYRFPFQTSNWRSMLHFKTHWFTISLAFLLKCFQAEFTFILFWNLRDLVLGFHILLRHVLETQKGRNTSEKRRSITRDVDHIEDGEEGNDKAALNSAVREIRKAVGHAEQPWAPNKSRNWSLLTQGNLCKLIPSILQLHPPEGCFLHLGNTKYQLKIVWRAGP